MRYVLIALALLVYWLALSGYYTTWLISMGVLSAIAVVAFGRAKGIIDREGFPVERIPGGLVYWPWLAWQIILSAINVTKIILSPKLPVSPKMVRVGTKQRSSVGITTYANSITLTPGTISVEVSERAGAIWVHAITEEGAEDMVDDEMNDRVRYFEEVGQ